MQGRRRLRLEDSIKRRRKRTCQSLWALFHVSPLFTCVGVETVAPSLKETQNPSGLSQQHCLPPRNDGT